MVPAFSGSGSKWIKYDGFFWRADWGSGILVGYKQFPSKSRNQLIRASVSYPAS